MVVMAHGLCFGQVIPQEVSQSEVNRHSNNVLLHDSTPNM
jgi:hypothetical protein